MRYLAFIVALLAASPVAASVTVPLMMRCDPASHAVVSEGLAQGYGESAVGRGVKDDGQAVAEVFANEETGTWTIMLFLSDGMACQVLAGEAFHVPDTVVPGTDS